MNINHLKSERVNLVSEARSALTAGDNAGFDKITAKIQDLDESIAREQRMAELDVARPIARDSVEGQMNRYSLRAAISGAAEGRIEGLEGEIAAHLAAQASSTRGFRVPLAAVLATERRDTNTTNAATTIAQNWGPIAGPLRPVSKVIRLGATVINNESHGALHIPTWEADVTPYWLPENGTVTESSPAFGEKVANAKDVAARATLSRRLLKTNSYQVDSMIANSMNVVLSNALDTAAMSGTGPANNQPLGVWNEVAATAPEAAISDTVNKLITSLELADNAPVSVLLTTLAASQARGVKDTTNRLISIQDQMHGLPYEVSNQWKTANRITVGTFSDAVLSTWSGVDMVIDPYTLAASGQLAITAFLTADWVNKFGAKSFAWADLASGS